MGDKNDKKKTKDEFTSFLLNDELTSQKTTVLSADKKNSALPDVPGTPLSQQTPPPLPSDTAKIKTDEDNSEKTNSEKTIHVLEKKEEKEQKTKSRPMLESVKNLFSDKSNAPAEKSQKVQQIEKSQVEKSNPFHKENMDPSLFSLEAALKQSEYLRIAQTKVKDLESKLQEVIKENETLTASATVLQKKFDQAINQLDAMKQDHKAQVENYKDELVLKDKIVRTIEKEKAELVKQNEELHMMMNEKIQQVRMRERELENRLEILHHEGDVIITNKDEIILDLKKQIDQLNFELDNFKAQSRELNKDIQNQKDQMRRTIKALKLALNLLENDELDGNELKKTGT